MYDKPTTNLMLNYIKFKKKKKLEDFPLNSEMRQVCPLSPLLLNTVLKAPVTTIRHEKEIKGIQIGKGKVKLSPYAGWHDNPQKEPCSIHTK